MLLLIDKQQVLLEQRPPHGIWGGLLSLPEIALPEADNPAEFEAQLAQAAAPFGVVAGYRKLAAFSHTFTHFKLHIAPYRVELSRRHAIAGQLQHQWLRADCVADAALPAPVKKLLLAVFAGQELY